MKDIQRVLYCKFAVFVLFIKININNVGAKKKRGTNRMKNTGTHFLTRLAKIEGRVHALSLNHHRKSVKLMEREANTCQAELEHLYDYAVQHNIDVTPHYEKLKSIQSSLVDVSTQLESQAKSIWARVIKWVGRAVEVVLDFLGLGSFAKRLIGGVSGFLTSGE